MNVRLHIEQLILEGLPVDAAQGSAVQAAVEKELMRLISEREAAHPYDGAGASADVRSAGFQMLPETAPESLGRHIGDAIHRSILP